LEKPRSQAGAFSFAVGRIKTLADLITDQLERDLFDRRTELRLQRVMRSADVVLVIQACRLSQADHSIEVTSYWRKQTALG
jgi:hypothetical protein